MLQVTMPEPTSKAGLVTLHGRSPGGSQDIERARILKALEEAKGRVGGRNGAAALLGMKRTTLQSRMKRFNVARQYH